MQELVARGRYPHQPLFTRWRKEDEEAVTKSDAGHGNNSSGRSKRGYPFRGQRQRAWIAMVLAQETAIMLLTNPRPGWISVIRLICWNC